MVIVPGKLIFLETPRTASRATAVAFETQVRDARRTGCRHVHVEDVPLDTGLPIWTFTREPVSHLFSWYKYGLQQKAPWVFVKDGHRTMSFDEFALAPFSPLAGFKGDRLNFYHGVAQHFWPLEKGIKEFFAYLGFQGIKVENIGKTTLNLEIKDVTKRIILRKFHKDSLLYDSVTIS